MKKYCLSNLYIATYNNELTQRIGDIPVAIRNEYGFKIINKEEIKLGYEKPKFDVFNDISTNNYFMVGQHGESIDLSNTNQDSRIEISDVKSIFEVLSDIDSDKLTAQEIVNLANLRFDVILKKELSGQQIAVYEEIIKKCYQDLIDREHGKPRKRD